MLEVVVIESGKLNPPTFRAMQAASHFKEGLILPFGSAPRKNIFPVVIDSLSNQQGKINNIIKQMEVIVLSVEAFLFAFGREIQVLA